MISLLRNPGPSEPAAADQRLLLKKEIHRQLIASMDRASIETLSDAELRAELRAGIEQLCFYRNELLTHAERDRLIDDVLNEALGLGPIEPLFRDPTVSDILINGPRAVFVERHGRLEDTDIVFNDEQHLLEIARRIAARVGRRLDESCPMVDARMEDGSRVNAVIRPLALDGALVSIRRFPARPLRAEDLVRRDTLTPEIVEFLAACVRARMNIVISGGTGSGKTTLLNVLSGFIPEGERIATIEDSAELQLQQRHVARMETRTANLEGRGEVTVRDLLRNSLRMRPDRIIVGECRGGEELDMLQAMNTGHPGSLCTLHANDTRDALSRLEMLVGMAGFDLPIWLIQRQIASAVDVLVHCARCSGGQRKVLQVSEVTGLAQDTIATQDLFRFEQTGLAEDGAAVGRFVSTEASPKCLQRLRAHDRMPQRTPVDAPLHVARFPVPGHAAP